MDLDTNKILDIQLVQVKHQLAINYIFAAAGLPKN